MEKYSKWRDGPTGIHPLIPTPSKPTSMASSIVFKGIIGPILALIRLPFIFILTLLLVCLDVLIKYIPIGFVKRMLKRTFSIVIGRTLLLFMGFFTLDEYTESIGNRTNDPIYKSFTLNDIFIVNHSSYVDIIYLYYKLSPMFAVPPNDRDPTLIDGKLIRLSLWKALLSSIYSPIHPTSSAVPTSELINRINETWDGPLVVFPEGTTSNGQGLLNISPIFNRKSTIKTIDSIHVLGITYTTWCYSACYSSVGSFFLHLYHLVSQVSNLMEIKYLCRTRLPDLPTTSNNSLYDDDIQIWFDKIFKTLSSLVNIRRTKLTSHDKITFMSYWNGYSIDKLDSNNKKNI